MVGDAARLLTGWADGSEGSIPSRSVWCVWTEWGEYEQFSRDLRGIFATPELAEEHAAQLRAAKRYDVCEVVRDDVLAAIPASVPYITRSAHITPDGRESHGSGYDRGEQFRTWDNELAPVESGRISRWHGHKHPAPDLFIEVIGSDKDAVEAEYERLLAIARERLSGSESPT